MDKLLITGGATLEGVMTISGAKNAALPLMATALMAEQGLVLDNLPRLADIECMCELLNHLGVASERDGDTVRFQPASPIVTDAPYDIVRKMRASVLVLGPLLARHGHARVSLPGGCAIGTRPVDLHIMAMERLGATVKLEDGYVIAEAKDGLKGAEVIFPIVSVGATENAMMAAALAQGQTVLINAAREPEIADLAHCLNAMGAKISGHGTERIVIDGVASLDQCRHRVVADRIEAGTFALAAAITRGQVTLTNLEPQHLAALFAAMAQSGIDVEIAGDQVTITAEDRPRSVDIVTDPYPGFPTDLQAQFMALMTLANGTSTISETIFENRFMHVQELVRLGARIRTEGRTAFIEGGAALSGAHVMATDLRASASLVLAGLVASGETVVERVYHLDRGYDRMERKLQALGAQISRQPG